MKQPQGVKAVVIGGGTGTFTVLSALKHYVPNLTAIINMVDNGGSTGVLRDELGALPPGDVRQALVALSSSSAVMRQLFNYRFPEGTFEGHAFGNLFLSALEQITGSFAAAVETAGEVLAISGRVIPVTTTNTHLCLRMTSGKVLEGQYNIETKVLKKNSPPDLFLKPAATINPGAAKAIEQADLIIICPGALYTSLVPTLIVDGMAETLKRAAGKKIYVCNLVTKPGQTDGLRVEDFVSEIERCVGAPIIDYVIYNNLQPPKYLLAKYAGKGELPVEYSTSSLAGKHYKAIGENLLSRKFMKRDPNDKLYQRNLIRHDSDKLARLFMRIYFS